MKQRTASGIAWSVGTISIGLMVGAALVTFADRHAAVPSGLKTWSLAYALDESSAVAVGLMAIVLVSRRPDNRIGWLFLFAAITVGLADFGAAYAVRALVVHPGTLPAGRAGGWLSNAIGPIPFILLAFLLLLFPTGRLPSRRWRPAAWFAGLLAGFALVAVVQATVDWNNPIPLLRNTNSGGGGWDFVLFGLAILAFGVCAVAPIVRFLGSRGEERQQLKWFALAAVPVLVTQFVGLSGAWAILQTLALLLLFGSIALAVLKYRLYEMDVVISRALIYGTLAAFITLMYVGLVVGLGSLVGNRRNPVLAAAAAAVVAVAFQPVRQRAGRLANRIVYGKRATPYEVLSDFAERISGAYSTEDVLPRMAQIVANGTGAGRAVVWLRVGDELRPEASSDGGPEAAVLRIAGDALPALPTGETAVPVTHSGELLGALSIAMPRGEGLTPAGQRLVSHVASQAGLVLRNVRLIEELRASRQRIVTAQDAAARRLERNIHDGAQQELVALSVKLRLAGLLAEKDPAKTKAMLVELQSDATGALENLRDLARGIYPPLLADQGLVAALRAQARRALVPVDIEPDGIGRYPPEHEAAVYFCCLEALQNVSKYAGASTATIRLTETDGGLAFEVQDDGAGFDTTNTSYGTGLQGMADRLAALGGELAVRSAIGAGTTVIGRLPVRAPELLG